MHRKLQLSSLIPAGLAVEDITLGDGTILISAKVCRPQRCARSAGAFRICPVQAAAFVFTSSPVGFAVSKRIAASGFLPNAFNAGVVSARSRRTARLDCIVHHLGLALGGRPGASFAKRLMLPVSNDTLLRIVRRRSRRPVATSLMASFATGISRDKSAVAAAIGSQWSNGQTEGQITKLKLVRRQMYGRAKIDLLEARLLCNACGGPPSSRMRQTQHWTPIGVGPWRRTVSRR